jgi:hypothetical protein
LLEKLRKEDFEAFYRMVKKVFRQGCREPGD